MAATPYGKVVLSERSNLAQPISETLGFVRVNPFSDSAASDIAAIQQFAGNIVQLTTNQYVECKVTYEISLDTWE